ncbi:MAG: 2-dehydropantoate 2-reductase [Chloroflexota bacterium]|nr:2-dehydropantoate 2-reductase [Dehalococcoidia bacterium]MEC8910429.1 2-dehydropantoate 2-reductase [Chloroflexota bacterium]PKB62434.1 MAG: 2-dehydropantoate 2-reductase [SAR202 cluster bacterium Ae2-Chloro-G3]MEC8958554.1 2-dehydropantoate 2-reductase [Chloroflexota bacterium]MEC9272886.1 2-dehydropantoate 2-reductase [Chloroflexota bacterium]|tara:strand:+ start:708 stop:1622 length:915 start_codon:yes stop_codon:yes gene_type:complete
MRIAIMGAGGVGGCLGGLLAKAGNDVSLIARGEHLEALREHGLKVIRPGGEIIVEIQATGDPSEVGQVDLVLFTVKTFQNRHVITSLKSLMGPETSVITLQNGVESHEQLSAVLGASNILPGAYWASSHILSPGVISEDVEARVSFGAVDDTESLRALDIRKVFRDAGIEAELSPDPLRVLWEKFVVLSALSGITSAAQTRPKELLQFPDARKMFCDAMEEALAVGLAKGVDLPANLVRDSLNYIDGLPDFQNTMHSDYEAGRPTELDALSGAVIRLGNQIGVKTPVHGYLYSVLLPHKDGAGG